MLLVDGIEETTEEMRRLHAQLHELDRHYRESYDRNVREEMLRVKNTLRQTRMQFLEELYRRLGELDRIRRNFPDFFSLLTEYEYIGTIIQKKLWLLDFRTKDALACEKELKVLRAQRRALRDARDFLKKWVGPIDAKSLAATWPMLVPHLKKTMDKDEALAALDRADADLRKKGWLLLLNEPFIRDVFDRFLVRFQEAQRREREFQRKSESAKGQGSVAEYEPLKKYREARKTRRRWERYLRHLLFINPAFHQKIKAKTAGIPSLRAALAEQLAREVQPWRMGEKAWLQAMEKKLSTH